MTLRPRVQAEVDRLVAEALAAPAPKRRSLIGGRSAPADARALRGLPAIGGPLGGAIPGTRPDRNRRLDRWRPKGRE
jgi:hypothetical protein